MSRHAELSRKLKYADLDWEAARDIGLSEREKRILPYFADVEGQTVYYSLELLKLPAARDPDTIAFLTIWNYEEHFHSQAIAKLLEVCGAPLEADRINQVRGRAALRARLEDLAQVVLSRLAPRAFVALWMAWGASQEALTLRGYEEMSRTTQNPVLAELCRRIAKQERRHFAFYYNSARERLAASPFARRFVRFIFERFWTPVGAGVKSDREVADLIKNLLPGDRLSEVTLAIDQKFSRLPGMEGFGVFSRYAESVQRMLPAGEELSPLGAQPSAARVTG